MQTPKYYHNSLNHGKLTKKEERNKKKSKNKPILA